MGLILFYYWTIIIFFNNSIVGMGLSAGSACRRRPRRAGPLRAGRQGSCRGTLHKATRRRKTCGYSSFWTFSFPSWGVFDRRIHYSVDERKSGRNSGRSDDIKDVIVYELCSRGGCFFRFSHRLCDGNIGNGDPQRASDARLNMSRQRLSHLPSPPGKVAIAVRRLTNEGITNEGVCPHPSDAARLTPSPEGKARERTVRFLAFAFVFPHPSPPAAVPPSPEGKARGLNGEIRQKN